MNYKLAMLGFLRQNTKLIMTSRCVQHKDKCITFLGSDKNCPTCDGGRERRELTLPKIENRHAEIIVGRVEHKVLLHINSMN